MNSDLVALVAACAVLLLGMTGAAVLLFRIQPEIIDDIAKDPSFVPDGHMLIWPDTLAALVVLFRVLWVVAGVVIGVLATHVLIVATALLLIRVVTLQIGQASLQRPRDLVMVAALVLTPALITKLVTLTFGLRG